MTEAQTIFDEIKTSNWVANDRVKIHLSHLDLGRMAKRNNQYQEAVDHLTESVKTIRAIEEKDYSFVNKDKDLAVALADLAEAQILYSEARLQDKSINKEKFKEELNVADTYLREAEQADIRYYDNANSRTMSRILFLLAKTNEALNYSILAKQYIETVVQMQQQRLESNHRYLQESKELQEAIVKQLSNSLPEEKKGDEKVILQQLTEKKNQIENRLKNKREIPSTQTFLEYGEICYRHFKKKPKTSDEPKDVIDNVAEYLMLSIDMDNQDKAQLGKVCYKLGKINHLQGNDQEAKNKYREAENYLKASLVKNPENIRAKKWLNKTLWSIQATQLKVTLSDNSTYIGNAAVFAAQFFCTIFN